MYKLNIKHGSKIFTPVTVGGVTYKSDSKSAAVLDFTIYRDDVALLEEGDVITFYVKNKSVFYGRVINIRLNGDKTINVTASDNLYYLKSRDSYNFINQTLSQIVRRVTADHGLPLGEIDESAYQIPFLCAPNYTLNTIIDNAIYEEQAATGEVYVLYCNFDKIMLKNVKNMKLPIIINKDNSSDFIQNSSIDTCYNRVKLSYADDEKGMEMKAVREDSKLIEKWGVLQYHETINGALNAAARADELLSELKKKKTMFSVGNTLGNIDVKAGSTLIFRHTEFGIEHDVYVISVKHTFYAEQYVMSLELQAV